MHERHTKTVIQRIITIYSIILEKKIFSHLPSYVVSLREVDYNCPFKSLKSNSCETACRLKRTRCMLYWGWECLVIVRMSYQGQTDSDLDNLIMIDTNQDLQCYKQSCTFFFRSFLFLKKIKHLTRGTKKSQIFSLYFWTRWFEETPKIVWILTPLSPTILVCIVLCIPPLHLISI